MRNPTFSGITVALGLVLVGPAGAGQARPDSAIGGTASSCPATAPAPGVLGHKQVGDKPLRALVPTDGIELADEVRGGGYHLEFVWLTGSRARLDISAERLDGDGEVTIYDPLRVKGGYGLYPVDLVLSDVGCWRLTAARPSAQVEVVLMVRSSHKLIDGWQGGACPVTEPSDPERGFGTDSLRVIVPDDGAYEAPADPEGGWSLKVPWYREREGHLTVRVKRLDGPGEGSVDIHESSYPPTGYLPTGVLVSDLGCWRITGKQRGQRVSVILRVKDAGAGPAG